VREKRKERSREGSRATRKTRESEERKRKMKYQASFYTVFGVWLKWTLFLRKETRYTQAMVECSEP
jgi:hypothetical protein